MNHRDEIDGLRAIAVIPVILFHAGFQVFGGGFVGVDVFFVISGYLITSIIISEMHKGAFTLVGFYERRIRRILPALMLVVFTCIPITLFCLLPQDVTQFAQSLVSVSLFASNILFYLKSGYFDSGAELKPLLHTWSLAVEEQYYLLYPMFLLLIWQCGKRLIVRILLVLGLFSLVAAHWGSHAYPLAAFFLLPTRAWELLIGALVAFYLAEPDNSRLKVTAVTQSLSMCGMSFIVYAVFAFDKHTPFPSLYGLIPTIGTALVLLFATKQTLVGKVLGSRILVGLGLISYSLYLWHHPLFAFARHRSLEEPDKIVFVVLTAACLILAYISWRWIETPFRNKQRISRGYVLVLGAVCSCTLIGLGLIGYFKNGFVEGFSPPEMKMFYYPEKHTRKLYREGTCFLTLDQAVSAFGKECAESSTGYRTLIWGDSHAAALSVGLRQALPSVTQYTAGGCPPIKDVVIQWNQHCKEINDFVMKEIERIRPSQIFLHANWTGYKDHEVGIDLAKTIRDVQKVVPSTRMTIVGAVPQWEPSLPKIMLLKGLSVDKETYIEAGRLHELIAMDRKLELVAIQNGAKFASAIDLLCARDKCQAVIPSTEGWALLTWDYGHLTEGGSRFLASKLLME
ncbi:MAG: acyltransferase [Candidatus Obscuribacterales bacterium]|nr:acyltransferase [Candidatus Obscuribacterales bacterium]